MKQASTLTIQSQLDAGARLAMVGVAVNIVLAIVKLSAGFLGQSFALIADGMESTLDVGSSLVIWGGLKLAAKPPDQSHPYGHGKAEPVAAIVVALVVMGAAVVLAFQSITRIVSPREAPESFTLVVLAAVILIKEMLYRTVWRAGQRMESTAVKSEAVHHRSDAITSVAAFIGIAIARTGGPGYESADAWVALVACGWIAFNGVRLFLPALKDVLDTAPPPEIEQMITATAKSVPGVQEIDQCRIRKMGLEHYVDIHIEVLGAIPVSDGHEIAHEVKDAIRAKHPTVADVLVHVEPVERAHRHRKI